MRAFALALGQQMFLFASILPGLPIGPKPVCPAPGASLRPTDNFSQSRFSRAAGGSAHAAEGAQTPGQFPVAVRSCETPAGAGPGPPRIARPCCQLVLRLGIAHALQAESWAMRNFLMVANTEMRLCGILSDQRKSLRNETAVA